MEITFEELSFKFPLLLSGLFDVECSGLAINDLFSSMSLYKLFMKYSDSMFTEKDQDFKESKMEDKVQRVIGALTADHDPNTNSMPMLDGRTIHEIEALIERVAQQIMKGDLSSICCLCFEPKALVALESACGHCSNMMCSECLRTWYQQLVPGHTVLPSHLLCPFCKQRPHPKTLKKYNKEILTITRCKVEVSTRWYHGWCLDCHGVREAVNRECLRENVPTITHFRCTQCLQRREAAIKLQQHDDDHYVAINSKQCPRCNAPTAKTSGCNHITCRCGAHWCFECGEEHPADSIYEHMNDAHGGIRI